MGKLDFLSRVHMGLIRRFTPNPSINWSTADLSAGPYTYHDATVEAEFKRFMYRNLTSLLACGGSSGALLLFPVIFPGQFPLPFAIINWCGAFALANMFAIDAYLLLVDDWTLHKAFLRSITGLCYGTIVVVSPQASLPTLYALCIKGIYFTNDAVGMRPQAANFLHDCVNVISPICILVVPGALTAMIEHPLPLTVFSVAALGVMYMGYLAPAPTILDYETPTSIGLKLLVYLLALLLAVVSAWAKFLRTRKQFESSVRAHAQAELTAQRAADVDSMLVAMLPVSALDRLMVGERVSDRAPSATVLFSDMVSFTEWSSARSCATVVGMLNTLCIEFDQISASLGVEKVKTIGDAYWAVCGLPEEVTTHAERMCAFAIRMHQTVRQLSARHAATWGSVRIRVGVNSGPVSGAMFGTQRLSYEVFGETSEIAEQCEKHGVPERVCIGALTSQMLPPSVELQPHETLTTERGSVVHMYLITPSGEAYLEAQKIGRGDFETSSHVGETTHTPTASHLEDIRSSRHGSMHSLRSDGNKPIETPHQSKDQALRRRRKFIEQRAARQAALAEQVEDSAEVEARLARREFSWIMLHFADPVVEEQYQAFVRDQHGALLKFTRGFMAALVGVQFVIIFSEGATVNPLSMSLLSVALAASIGLLVGAFLGLPPLVDAVILYIVFLLDVVGCGTLPDALVGNDPSYLVSILIAVAVFGVTRLASFTIIGLVSVFVVAPTLYFVWSHLLFLSDLLVIQTSLALYLPLAVSTEKMNRRQFIERLMQQHNAALQLRREAEQKTLLESIVPTHVIEPLQRWMHEEHMDPSRTIARVLEKVAVGFLKLYPVTNASPASEAAAEDDAQWLFEAHTRLDEVLGRHPEFDKVKTIGDVVMVAGSFTAEYSCGEAVVGMLEALREALSHVRLRAGLHVGEVMGAVLGTARLCFDIFGDSVNTASRVLTTLPPDETLGVSEAFYEVLATEAQQGPLGGPFAFSGAVERAAKGKGVILVRHAVMQNT